MITFGKGPSPEVGNSLETFLTSALFTCEYACSVLTVYACRECSLGNILLPATNNVNPATLRLTHWLLLLTEPFFK